MSAFATGINYWPNSSAMYMWKRFDLGEIREDFAMIAGLGLDTVRFFLHWEDFQPEADRLDRAMTDRFVAVLDALNDAKLLGMPTLFTGHMSGVNFLPFWTLDRRQPHGRFRTITNRGESPFGIGDYYTGALLEAQRFACRTLGAAVRGHPALWVWDLGNEFSNLRAPASESDAAEWSWVLSDELRSASEAPVTGGTHGEDLFEDRKLRASSLCTPWIFPTMHGYSVYSAFARSRLDYEIVPFSCRLWQSFSRKLVLFSEFGNPTCARDDARVTLRSEREARASKGRRAAFECLSEDEMCDYAYNALDRLHACGALGGFWWCFADYAPALHDTPPFDRAKHELTFGIMRGDRTLKPIAHTLARFAAERRETLPPPAAPLADAATWYAELPSNIRPAYERYLRDET